MNGLARDPHLEIVVIALWRAARLVLVHKQ